MILNVLPGFVSYYHYLESSLIDLIQIIPLENNGMVQSPRLYEILQSTCSQFESLLKLLCQHLGLNPASEQGIRRYYNPINKYGLLYWQMMTYRMYPFGVPIYPFRKRNPALSFRKKSEARNDDTAIKRLKPVPSHYCKDQLPKWWQNYNKSKHELPAGYKEGNLQNTCTALAGLYSLHALCYHLIYDTNGARLDPKKWYYTYPHLAGIHQDQVMDYHAPTFPSKLFIYLVRPNLN